MGKRKILSVLVYKSLTGLHLFTAVDTSPLPPQYHCVKLRLEIPLVRKIGYVYHSCYIESVGFDVRDLGVKFPFSGGHVTWGCLLPLLDTQGSCMHTLISKDRWVFPGGSVTEYDRSQL